MPTKIYLQTVGGPFQIRSLLTLSILANPAKRKLLFDGYSLDYIPSRSGEVSSDYETRVVDMMFQKYLGYQKLSGGYLCLVNVNSSPDGLFLNNENQDLVIIEAKQRKADFSEGTAQIVQYYAQAKHHSSFQNLTIKSHLVISNEEQTSGYRIWQELIQSTNEIRFFVDTAD